ncbi:MAG: hypothetical protein HY278_01705 [candidate division NC10 bacterium]|nr:hypothetical protein [candidate division NC10 bacterium]
MVSRSPLRFPLMALGMVGLLAAMWGGLLRLGWNWPIIRPTLAAAHGPLMISGFLGTLISLERAVALGQSWTYGAPLLTGLGTLALIAGVPGLVGPLLMVLGSLGLVAIFFQIVRSQPAIFTVVIGLGALAWLVGNSLWLAGYPIFGVVPWWAGFLVLTIAGERLELSRFVPVSQANQVTFLAAIGLLSAGLLLTRVAFDGGARLSGLGLLALTVWLLRHDIARRAVRKAGLTRFVAVSLLSGYVWLGIGGLLWLRLGGVVAGPYYDAVLHAIFLGFVLSMIVGHAPIIFPAVLGMPMPFRPAFYAHLAVLHLSLALRVVGDLAMWWPGRLWGGLLNVSAVLLFLVNTALSVKQGRGLSRREAL